MSPFPDKAKDHKEESQVVEPVKKVEPSAATEVESSRPITILSELDSYIAERMKGQPKTLDEVSERAEMIDSRPRHRLELPEYFERLNNDNKKFNGPYIFRWIFKEKRAVDKALNAYGWVLVNRSYFREAPRYLFTANGGVEVGDAILAFMPAKKAKVIREAPGKVSQERLKGQMTQVSPDYVLMTPNRNATHVYEPKLSPESEEESNTVPVEGMQDTLIQRGVKKGDFE